jgi:2-polyprenyl-3-methyl-5-hydroxy-6-metoxy-1,4-benzoquinol methylase
MPDQATRGSALVQQLFDEKAATWSAKYAPAGRLAGRLTRFADAAGYHVRAGGRVLDLGCGTGNLARQLAAAGMSVTGCDISPQMLQHASRVEPASGISWVQLDPGWRRLPFAAASFEAVIASSVLEYVSSPAAVIGEGARILAPGGVMLCTVPNITHPVRWLEWLACWAARVPAVCAASRAWPRLAGCVTYLQTSRHRQSTAWWCAVATRAGLTTLPLPTGAGERSPLRLFIFQRSEEQK